jgi:hypothetical protein
MGLTLSHSQKIEWYYRTCKKMLTTFKLEKIEFVPTSVLWKLREFDRSPMGDLRYSVMEKGLQEPIMLIYYSHTRRAYVGEGNHRIAIARSLGLEALPTRVVRSESTTTVKGVKIKGIDTDEFGYVRASLYPSEIGLKAYSLKKLCR